MVVTTDSLVIAEEVKSWILAVVSDSEAIAMQRYWRITAIFGRAFILVCTRVLKNGVDVDGVCAMRNLYAEDSTLTVPE
jgi:hypothetical protein